MKTLGLNRFVMPSLASPALVLGLALASFAPAAAQEMTPEQACSGDAQSLCGAFIPDRAKVGACLRRNARSLSAACRTFVVGGGPHVTHGRTHVRGRVYHHSSRHHK
jgi:hypothetical protein